MLDAITAYAAAASVIAALLTVLLTHRLTRSNEVRQWRRETARQNMVEFARTAGMLDRFRRELDDSKQEKIDGYKSIIEHVEGIQGPPSEQLSMFKEAALAHIKEQRDEALERVESLLARLDLQLDELELSATPRCISAARSLKEAVQTYAYVRIFLDHKEPEIYEAKRVHELVNHARGKFLLACRLDLGVDRRIRFRIPQRFRRRV